MKVNGIVMWITGAVAGGEETVGVVIKRFLPGLSSKMIRKAQVV